MKKIIFILLSFIIITGCANKEDAKVNSIDSKIYQDLIERVTKLENQSNDDNKKDLDDLKKEIDGIKDDINKADELSVSDDINDLKSKYSSLLNKYNNVSKENENLKKELNNLKNKSSNSDIHKVTFDGKIIIQRTDYTQNSSKNIKYIYENYSLLVKNGDTIGTYMNFEISSGVYPPYNKPTYRFNQNDVSPFDGPNDKEFAGWYSEKDGKGTKYDLTTVINVDNDLVLYPYFIDSGQETTPELDIDSENEISSDNE